MTAFAAGPGILETIAPGISRILAPNPGPFTFRGTGVYVVGTGRDAAVIDPGPDDPAHLGALRRALADRRVTHILITHTHRDHSPAAAMLKQWSGAKTYGHGPHATPPSRDNAAEEGADFDFAPDVALPDGARIEGDGFALDAVFTPGHAANHLCFAYGDALFTGDHVMGWSTSVIAPPDGDMAAYMASLEKLLARDDRVYYPTHGAPVDDPRALVRDLLRHRRARETQIADALRDTHTVAALTARIYPGLDPRLTRAAGLSLTAHLEKLADEGRARRDGESWRPA